jgi:hypothetical protein
MRPVYGVQCRRVDRILVAFEVGTYLKAPDGQKTVAARSDPGRRKDLNERD